MNRIAVRALTWALTHVPGDTPIASTVANRLFPPTAPNDNERMRRDCAGPPVWGEVYHLRDEIPLEGIVGARFSECVFIVYRRDKCIVINCEGARNVRVVNSIFLVRDVPLRRTQRQKFTSWASQIGGLGPWRPLPVV